MPATQSPVKPTSDFNQLLDNVEKILYIKLGASGAKDQACFESNKIFLDYRSVDHEICLQNDEDRLIQSIQGMFKANTLTWRAREILRFYNADEKTLWVTFSGNMLYWCFATNEIALQNDGTKLRTVNGKWHHFSLEDKMKLSIDVLPGSVTKKKIYPRTTSYFDKPDAELLLRIIRNEQGAALKEVQGAFNFTKEKILSLIQQLNETDFESLVDICFSNIGLKRLGPLGKSKKTMEASYYSPLLATNIHLQVKCSVDRNTFNEWLEKAGDYEDGEGRPYFVVHQPADNLINYLNERPEELNEVEVIYGERLAQLVMDAGMTEWVLAKAF